MAADYQTVAAAAAARSARCAPCAASTSRPRSPVWSARSQFKSGDEVAASQVLAQLNADADIAQLHALRGRRRPRVDGLRARQGAARGGGGEPGAGRRRRRGPQGQARAGGAAGGARRQEDDPRAVRRQARHQHGEPGPVSQRRRQARDAAGARSDLRRLHACRSSSCRSSSSASKVTLDDRRLQGHGFAGKITAINSEGRRQHAQRPGRGDDAESEAAAAAGHVRRRVQINSGDEERYLTLPQTAITYNPYGDTVFVVEPSDTKDAKRQGAQLIGAADLRHHGAEARRPGRDPEGHRARARRS